MPVIVEDAPEALHRLTASMPAGTYSVASVEQLRSWLAANPEEYVVTLGPTVQLEDALQVAESLRHSRPSTSVVLVREAIETTVLYEAMHAGCRDVVLTADDAALRTAVQRAHQLWSAVHTSEPARPGGRRGRVITVFSPKGGVGKTTASVNLALALAQTGASKVCLIDLDLAFGDVAITMQLAPTHTIEDAIGDDDAVEPATVASLLTRHEHALMVLAAPNLPDGRDRVTATLVARIIRALRHEFDHIVIDTSQNFDEQTLQALDETDECLVVTTLDIPTLKNVKVAVETLDLLDIARDRRHLVLNRADDAVGLAPEEVEQILGMPIATRIPTSIDVAAATNAGRPIVIAKPAHPASRAFTQLANTMAGGAKAAGAPGGSEGPERRGRWRRSKVKS